MIFFLLLKHKKERFFFAYSKVCLKLKNVVKKEMRIGKLTEFYKALHDESFFHSSQSLSTLVVQFFTRFNSTFHKINFDSHKKH